jgi:cyclopropane-fatty-acyl-phospholipid synthase
MNEQLHDSRANLDNFIDTYIFPGGYLPSVNRLVSSLHAGSRGKLEVESVSSIGPHYVKTLRLWREKFCENWPRIRASYTKGRPDLSEEDIETFRRRWIVSPGKPTPFTISFAACTTCPQSKLTLALWSFRERNFAD